MKENLKISVITPSFNSSTYLEDAIQSVLMQNYPDFEHIIVDGGSTDKTLEILNKYDHLKWVSEPDRGQSDAMNKGFGMSSGDIIVYLNADDFFLPNAFNRVVPYFRKGAKFVMGKVRVVKENGQCWLNDPKIRQEDMLRHWERNAFCVNPVGYFYLREVQENSAGFDLDNHLSMDLDFLLECSSKYTFTKISDPNPLGVFRLFTNTKTIQSYNEVEGIFNFENFGFIDKYLAGRSEAFVSRYNRQRHKAYKRLIRRANADNGTIFARLDNYFANLNLRIGDFMDSETKLEIIRNYFKRKFKP